MESKNPPTYTEEFLVDSYDYDIRSLQEIHEILPLAKPSVMEKILSYIPNFFMIVTHDETLYKRFRNNDETKYQYKENRLKISKLLDKYVYMYDDIYITLSIQMSDIYMQLLDRLRHDKEKKNLLEIIEIQKNTIHEYKKADLTPYRDPTFSCQLM